MMFKSLSFVYSLLLALFINPATAAFDPATELKVLAADGAANDFFGSPIAIDGNRMAVGVYNADIGGNINQGAVYIYDFDGTNWSQTAKLTASDGATFDFFGVSVSLSGNRLAVGALYADIGSNTEQGATYVFDLSGGTWSETTKLTAADGAANDWFGIRVDLSNNRLAVGAYADDSYQGSAYVFDFNGGIWSQTAKLVASDGATDDRFGVSVALSGNRLVVGANYADTGGNSNQGAAYIFDLSGGSWSETIKLTASDGAANDRFGYPVLLSSNRLIVGVNGNDGNQGAAYVFDLSGSTWSQTTKLVASDGTANDYFGGSLSLSGNRLAVGANAADIAGNNDQGATYVFDLSGGTWSETTKLTASDGVAYDRFGSSAALSDNRLAVGSYRANIGANSDQGAVYVYTDDVIFKNGFEQE